MLILVFVGSLIKPLDNDWGGAAKSFTTGNGWGLADDSIIKMVSNTGLKKKLVAAEEVLENNPKDKIAIENVEKLKDKLFYTFFARILLLILFIGISLMVYVAHKKRSKEGRITV
jgi:hypothetical protein